MVQLKWLGTVSLFLLLLPACEKDDFTQPASLELELSASETPAMEGKLAFREVVMQAQRMEIEGRRKAGEDVFFERDLRAGAIAVHEHPSILLDLPQGIYNRLMLSLVFNPDEEAEEEMKRQIDDLLDELKGNVLPPAAEAELGELILRYREGKPGFICTGTYSGEQEDLEVVLVINDPFILSMAAVNSGGTKEIVLERDKNNSAALRLDFEKWFSVVPEPLMEKALKGRAGGKNYVLIHKKVNHQLFNMLYNRIEQYTTLVVNE